MELINRALGALLDAALSPFQSLPPIAGLAAVSLVVSIAMLLVVRAATNQRAIVEAKRRIQAALFEIRLFNDDARALYGVRDALRHNLTYLRLSLATLPWVIVPLTFLIAHLQFYYGYEGFAPGQAAVLTAQVRETALPPNGLAPAIAIESPPGLRVETPLLWIPGRREAAWRIGIDRPGDYDVVVTLDGQSVTKQVRVSERVGRRAPGRFEARFLNQLLYPGEPPIAPEMPIAAIEIEYPERAMNLLGLRVDWLVAFLVMSLAAAWLIRPLIGVEL